MSIRRLAAIWFSLVVVLLLVQGCGFEPLLAARPSAGSAADDLSKIRIAYIQDRSGQILRNHLISALTPRGEPVQPAYVLTVRIEEPQQNIAYRRDDSISRYGYGVNAYWTLRDSAGRALMSSSSSSSTTFAVSDSEYATLASLQNARDRLMQDISQDIRYVLSSYFFSSLPPASGK